IVDLFLVGVLAAGWVVSRLARRAGRGWSAVPVRAALVVAVAYIGAMRWIGVQARDAAAAGPAGADPPARDVMAAPQPLAWRVRDVLVRRGDGYDWSRVTWSGGRVTLVPQSHQPAGADSATVARVRATPDGRKFLRWSRFPYFVPGTGADSGTTFVGDARYSSGTEESWAGIRVRTPRE
ncbi:MAG TPA: hypothetical protein VG916_01320, partial [Gemmatimonadaceae bacterium]|nr:hypothetical protein [Gemmatimonadaceae bacterium]